MGDLSGATEVGGAVVTLTADLSNLSSIASKGSGVMRDEAKKLAAEFSKTFSEAVAHASPGAFTGKATATVSGNATMSDAARAKYRQDTEDFKLWVAQDRAAKREKYKQDTEDFRMFIAQERAEKKKAREAEKAAAAAEKQQDAGGGYYNPFSTRGLARMVGSGLAVYALQEISQLVTSGFEAYQIASRPDRVLHSWQSSDSPFDVMGSPYLQQLATQQAHIGGYNHFAGGLKNIPFIGWGYSMGAAASGSEADLQDQESQIQRDAQNNIAANEYLMSGGVRSAARLNDPALAASAASRRATAILERRQAESPNDIQIGQAIAQSRLEGHFQTAAEIRKQYIELIGTELTTKVFGAEGAAIQSGKGADRLGAFDLSASGRHRVLEAQRNERLKEFDDQIYLARNRGDTAGERELRESRVRAERAANAEIAKSDAEAAKNRITLQKEIATEERQIGAEITQLTGQASANRLRVTKDFFAAEMTELQASNKAKLDAIEDNEKNQGARKATKEAGEASVQSLIAQQQEKVFHWVAAYATRDQVALANLSNMPMVARASSEAGGAIEELRTAPKEVFKDAQKTIIDELRAAEHEMFGTTGGAVAATYRAGQMGVVGDPMGWSGRARQQANARKILDDAINKAGGMTADDRKGGGVDPQKMAEAAQAVINIFNLIRNSPLGGMN